MGYYRASFPSGGQYTQEDIDSCCVVVDGVRFAAREDLFRDNITLNSPVNIGDNVNYVKGILMNCYNFNSPVKIGNNVTNMSNAFQNCREFNQPVQIPSTLKNGIYMLQDCYSFNSLVNFPQELQVNVDFFYLFGRCYNFNQPVTIPYNVTRTAYMFDSCNNFNQSLIIPETVNNCAGMVRNCNQFGGNIYIKGNSFRNIAVKSLFNMCNNALQKNVFFNFWLTNQFTVTTGNSVVGTTISWTTMTNGRYNAAYNIYLYNNYSG